MKPVSQKVKLSVRWSVCCNASSSPPAKHPTPASEPMTLDLVLNAAQGKKHISGCIIQEIEGFN